MFPFILLQTNVNGFLSQCRSPARLWMPSPLEKPPSLPVLDSFVLPSMSSLFPPPVLSSLTPQPAVAACPSSNTLSCTDTVHPPTPSLYCSYSFILLFLFLSLLGDPLVTSSLLQFPWFQGKGAVITGSNSVWELLDPFSTPE